MTTKIKYRHAIEDVANRLMDLADIIDRGESYDAAGFLRATERRCRRLLAGGDYTDTIDPWIKDLQERERDHTRAGGTIAT